MHRHKPTQDLKASTGGNLNRKEALRKCMQVPNQVTALNQPKTAGKNSISAATRHPEIHIRKAKGTKNHQGTYSVNHKDFLHGSKSASHVFL